MKKLMTIAAGVLLTGSALANTVTYHNNAKLETAEFATKAEALNAGYAIADEIAASSQNELRKELRLFSTSYVRNIGVDKTEIKTQEFARTRGDIQYRAIVNVNYHFDTQDND